MSRAASQPWAPNGHLGSTRGLRSNRSVGRELPVGCVGTMIKNICPVKGPKSYYIVKREHFTNKEKWMNGINMCFCPA